MSLVIHKNSVFAFGLIDLTFDSRMDVNGKRSFFLLNLLCRPALRLRLDAGITLLSIYIYVIGHWLCITGASKSEQILTAVT